LKDLLALCRSPIEQKFLRALCVIASEHDEHETDDGRPYLWMMREDYELHVFPSFMVVAGGLAYTLDFAMGNVGTIGKSRLSWSLAVECDGHDYHERTKEQAARDRQRDRALLLENVITIRFTGAELYADAERCASEAVQLASHIDSVDQWTWTSGWDSCRKREVQSRFEAEEDRLP
jgi:hypothetical protein